jgi:hypothetical protein
MNIFEQLNIPHKYSTLERYFKNIDVEDLIEFQPAEIIEIANPEDKLLMKLLVKRYLGKIIANKSFVYKGSQETLYVTIQKSSTPDSVAVLDCSNNNFNDDVILKIKQTLPLIPNCDTINLSNNKILGVANRTTFDKHFIDLLNTEIKCVNITNNPIIQSRNDLFEKIFTADHYNKLIFIDQESVRSDFWKSLVKHHPSKIALIESTHNKYYSQQLLQ